MDTRPQESKHEVAGIALLNQIFANEAFFLINSSTLPATIQSLNNHRNHRLNIFLYDLSDEKFAEFFADFGNLNINILGLQKLSRTLIEKIFMSLLSKNKCPGKLGIADLDNVSVDIIYSIILFYQSTLTFFQTNSPIISVNCGTGIAPEWQIKFDNLLNPNIILSKLIKNYRELIEARFNERLHFSKTYTALNQDLNRAKANNCSLELKNTELSMSINDSAARAQAIQINLEKSQTDLKKAQKNLKNANREIDALNKSFAQLTKINKKFEVVKNKYPALFSFHPSTPELARLDDDGEEKSSSNKRKRTEPTTESLLYDDNDSEEEIPEANAKKQKTNPAEGGNLTDEAQILIDLHNQPLRKAIEDEMLTVITKRFLNNSDHLTELREYLQQQLALGEEMLAGDTLFYDMGKKYATPFFHFMAFITCSTRKEFLPYSDFGASRETLLLTMRKLLETIDELDKQYIRHSLGNASKKTIIDELSQKNEEQVKKIKNLNSMIGRRNQALEKKDEALEQKDKEIAALKVQINSIRTMAVNYQNLLASQSFFYHAPTLSDSNINPSNSPPTNNTSSSNDSKLESGLDAEIDQYKGLNNNPGVN